VFAIRPQNSINRRPKAVIGGGPKKTGEVITIGEGVVIQLDPRPHPHLGSELVCLRSLGNSVS